MAIGSLAEDLSRRDFTINTLAINISSPGEIIDLHEGVNDIEKKITQREQEIIELVTQGKENKEIAGYLDIKENTIRNHLHSIFLKLNVGTRLELSNLFK